jgi:mannan endo-1,4-beta-mannosidase
MNKPSRPTQLISVCLVMALAALACTIGPPSIEGIPTVDPDATDETKALFMKLYLLSDSNQTLFGHQDDTYFGVGWAGDTGRSDVKDVADSYPAVYGWEVGDIELGRPTSLDGVPFDRMREEIIAAYRRGGVITISWHMNNPVTYELIDTDPENNQLGRAWDRTPAVLTILPDGGNGALYRSWLDAFADFAKSLTVSGVPWKEEEHLAPIIFRPFHEHNGSVFWWGGRNTTEYYYAALWQYTVRYLRDEAGVHNLLYAFSPDARFMRSRGSDYMFPDVDTFGGDYFYAYPGDDYVDVFGLDFYMNIFPTGVGADVPTIYENHLEMLVQTAQNRNDLKIPALTETGLQNWPDDHWWTTYLYPAIVGSRSAGGQVAYVLTWRNWSEADHSGPYPGGSDAMDFIDFAGRPMIHLEDEIPFNMYTWP